MTWAVATDVNINSPKELREIAFLSFWRERLEFGTLGAPALS
jgi:hypothetical protein